MRSLKNVFKYVLLDLALAGLILCVFALFHHVLPYMEKSKQNEPTPVAAIPTPTPAPETAPEELSWREKFDERFSNVTMRTDSSYVSKNVSVTISRHTAEKPCLVYYVADIYIADIDCFQTAFAANPSTQPIDELASESGAVLAINGDYCTNQTEGLLVRNGKLYLTEQTSCDICVLYYDGTIETYGPDEYSAEEIIARGPYQVWKFGPELLEDGGGVKQSFNTSDALLQSHPRSALGYYEPGHYCFVVVDGRQPGYSDGLDMKAMAQLFSDLGCVSAYNLDGGASAGMAFLNRMYSRPSGDGRDVADILLIKEPD